MESSQSGVGVGHANAASPFRGYRTARCLLHTPPLLCREFEGSSLASRSHTCLRVCASNVCTQVLPGCNFSSRHSPPPSLLTSVLLSSPFPFSPPPAHLCVVVLASFPPPLPFSATTFPFCSVLRAQTVAGVRAESELREMLLMLQLFGLHVSFWAH